MPPTEAVQLPIPPEIENSTPPEPEFRNLSAESQTRLRALCGYLDGCAATIQEIRARLAPMQPDAKSRDAVDWSLARLGRICLEADSWGYDELYLVAAGLQRLLMESRNAGWTARLGKVVDRSLSAMSSLVSNWDLEFRRSLELGELIEDFQPTTAQ